MKVQHQVAIIYCGTQGLILDVPTDKVLEFEKEYLEYLDLKHKDTLDKIAEGAMDDEIKAVLASAAKEISAKYKK